MRDPLWVHGEERVTCAVLVALRDLLIFRLIAGRHHLHVVGVQTCEKINYKVPRTDSRMQLM